MSKAHAAEQPAGNGPLCEYEDVIVKANDPKCVVVHLVTDDGATTPPSAPATPHGAALKDEPPKAASAAAGGSAGVSPRRWWVGSLVDSLLAVPERSENGDRYMNFRSLQPPGEPAMLKREDHVRPPLRALPGVLGRLTAMSFLYAIPVSAFAITPVLVFGLVARSLSEAINEPDLPLGKLRTDVGRPEVTMDVTWLMLLPSMWNVIALGSVWYFSMFAPYKGRVFNKVFVRTEGAHLTVWVLWALSRPSVYQALGDSKLCAKAHQMQALVHNMWTGVSVCIFYYKGFSNAGNKYTGVWMCIVVLLLLLLFLVLQNTLGMLLRGPDSVKVAAAGVFLPLVMHAFIYAPARLIARSMPHADAMFRFSMLVGLQVTDKMYSRMLILSIQNMYMVGLACVASGSVGGVIRWALGEDDRRLYKVLVCLGARGDPEAIAAHPENYYLQSTTTLSEIVLDITAVWSAAVMSWSYGVQLEHGTPPSVQDSMQNAALQTGIKLVSISVIGTFALYGKKEDLVSVLRRLPAKWLVLPCLATSWGGAQIAAVWLPMLLCRPTTGEGYWTWCRAK